MIIGINGYAQTGKDTAADYLVDQHGFKRRAFADALRACMMALNPIVDFDRYEEDVYEFGSEEPVHKIDEVVPVRYGEALVNLGYEEAKATYPEVRELLQRFGTEVGRNILGPNIWVETAMRDLDPSVDYVFTDMRFPNEFQAIQDVDGYTVRIERPGQGPANDHPSETSLDDFDFDFYVENDGSLEDYFSKWSSLISLVKGTPSDPGQSFAASFLEVTGRA